MLPSCSHTCFCIFFLHFKACWRTLLLKKVSQQLSTINPRNAQLHANQRLNKWTLYANVAPPFSHSHKGTKQNKNTMIQDREITILILAKVMKHDGGQVQVDRICQWSSQAYLLKSYCIHYISAKSICKLQAAIKWWWRGGSNEHNHYKFKSYECIHYQSAHSSWQ